MKRNFRLVKLDFAPNVDRIVNEADTETMTSPPVVEDGEFPDAPEWLPLYAKLEWERVAPQFKGRLGSGIQASLEHYCICVGQAREAEEIMIREGRIIQRTVNGETGKFRHPAFGLQQGALREARLHAIELKLTRPAARAKKGDWEDTDLLA